jgi:hypothetical protein
MIAADAPDCGGVLPAAEFTGSPPLFVITTTPMIVVPSYEASRRFDHVSALNPLTNPKLLWPCDIV